MTQNKSVEEVVGEKARILILPGIGVRYLTEQDVIELLQQERQTSQEREREVVEAVKDALPIKQDEECPDDYDCPYCKRGLSNKCDTMDVPRVINKIRNDVLEAIERLTNPNKD